VTQFASAEDLGDFLGEPLAGARLTQAYIALELASAVIQSWARQQFVYVEDDIVLLAGTDDWELPLPERPVVDVTVVTVDGVALAPATDYLLSGGVLRRAGGWAGATGLPSVVSVTYSHGFEVIPGDVRAVTLALAARMLANPVGVRQEGIGSYNVTYGADLGGAAEVGLASLGRYRVQAASVRLGRACP
jgi:hypothetical protein